MIQPGAADSGDVGMLVLAALGAGERSARFVRDIRRAVREQSTAADNDELEATLTRLEEKGRVLVRDHYCADPHLEGVDLRIAGLVQERASGEDPQSACIAAIEDAWTEWITEYLAEHRCS